MAFAVPHSYVPLLLDPPYVLALFALGAAVGRRLLRLVRAPLSALTRAEYGVVAAALGTGLLQYPMFALGVTGHLTPIAIRVVLGLLALALAGDVIAVARALGHAVAECCGSRRVAVRSWAFWLLLALAPAALLAFLQTLTPVTDMDGIGYHLGIPRRWLGVGRMEYVPTMYMAQLPLGQEMLYTAAIATWSEESARLIHFGFCILACVGLGCLGRRVARPNVGLAAVTVLLVGLPAVSVLELSTWAYTELGIACEMIAAFVCWTAWRRTRAAGWLVAAFACAGLALSFKITTGFFALGLACLTVVASRRSGAARAMLLGAGGFAVSLAVFSPWPIRSWAMTGNPAFPFLSGVFPTRDWNEKAARQFAEYFRYAGWGTGRLLGSLNDSERQMVVVAAVLVAVLVAAFLLWRVRDPDARACAALAGLLTAVYVWNTGLYMRYLVPVLPFWLLAAAPLAASRWRGRGPGTAVVAVTLLGAGWYVARSEPGPRDAAAFALGRGNRAAYLGQALPTYPVAQYANRNLPGTSLILVAGAAPQYYYDAPLIFMDVVRMRYDEWGNFLGDLRRNGVTHILVSRTFYDDVPPGAVLPNKLYFIRRVVAERGELLIETPSDRLLALKPAP